MVKDDLVGRRVEGVLALLFPGQGSQTPGDRAEVARLAPDLLWQCIEQLGEDPFERVGESTRFAQPALFITSIARFRAARLGQSPAAFAGHSLGELSALVAAGALSMEDGLSLVIERGRLMAEAPAGAMVAVRGDAETARPIAESHGWVVANDNAPGQVVLSGDASCTDALIADAAASGLRCLALPVTGAFHSPLMALPAMEFVEALAAVDFQRPTAPVYCCATAAPFTDPRAQLAGALTAPVRWREVLLALRDRGIDTCVDVGPGQVIDGLVRRALPDVDRTPIAPLLPPETEPQAVSPPAPRFAPAARPARADAVRPTTSTQERSDALA